VNPEDERGITNWILDYMDNNARNQELIWQEISVIKKRLNIYSDNDKVILHILEEYERAIEGTKRYIVNNVPTLKEKIDSLAQSRTKKKDFY